MKYFRVKNFEKYQPKRLNKHQPWVCLYVNWTKDWAVMQLNDSQKGHWACIICTAHENDNFIRYDSVWIKQQHSLSTSVNLVLFEKLGLIEVCSASMEIAQKTPQKQNPDKLNKIKDKLNIYTEKQNTLFELDWNDLPRKEGNKEKAKKDWLKSKCDETNREFFLGQKNAFKKAMSGRVKKYIATGQTFFHNWENMTWDESPDIAQYQKTGGAVL